jgi:hypothetical protein
MRKSTTPLIKPNRARYVFVFIALSVVIVGIGLWLELKTNSNIQITSPETARHTMSTLRTTQLAEFLADWPYIENFFNSVFFTSIAGAFAGALSGAYTAQKIAEGAKNKDQLLKEIHAVNAAIVLTFGVCNRLLTAKAQFIKPIKTQFDKDRADTEQKIKAAQEASGPVEVNFVADLRTLPTIEVPIPTLQVHVFEKLSLSTRPLLATTTLVGIVSALNSALIGRNEFIDKFKASRLPSIQKVALYFGFPLSNGALDEAYPSLLRGIYEQTDHGIFYSKELCKELIQHGERLSDSFLKQFGKGSPSIVKPNFEKAKDADLMPNEDDYADWRGAIIQPD